MYRKRKIFAIVLAACIGVAAIVRAADGSSLLPVIPLQDEHQSVFVPETLGVIVNLNDRDSVALGNYYANSRGIPRSNIVGLRLPRANFVTKHIIRRELSVLESHPLYSKFFGFALAFEKPYRVDANQSITSAFALGVTDMRWQGNCNVTAENPDRNAKPGEPLTAKPAFLLDGGEGLASSMALVERGKSADASSPKGVILLAKTSDAARSKPREASMDRARSEFPSWVNVEQYPNNLISSTRDLIGMQTGLSVIRGLGELRFLPGAYADHLTSYGGMLYEKMGQTNVREIVAAGATAAFGTVREPCNFSTKFPDPERVATSYLGGDSILESYWKSIGWVTEGLLVGEPLARPFPVLDAYWSTSGIELRTNLQTPLFLRSSERLAIGKANVSGEGREDFRLQVFSVASGRPEYIQNIVVRRNAEPGYLIATIPVDGPKLGKILGVKLEY